MDDHDFDTNMTDVYGSPTLHTDAGSVAQLKATEAKLVDVLTQQGYNPVADKKASAFELNIVQQALPEYIPPSHSPTLELPVHSHGHAGLAIRYKRKPGANVTGRPSKAQKVKPRPQPQPRIKPNRNITTDLPAGIFFLRPTKTKSHFDFTVVLMRSEKTKTLENMLNGHHASTDSDFKSSFLGQPIAPGDWRGAYCTVRAHEPTEKRDKCDIDHPAQLRFYDQVTWAELLWEVYEGHPTASCYEVMGNTYRGPYYEFYAIDVSLFAGEKVEE